MKMYGKLLTAVAMSLLLMVSQQEKTFAAIGWHQLSDEQRNNYILWEAQSWPIGTIGGTCKEWVRIIVSRASGGVVNIPSTYTMPDAYKQAKWVNSSDVQVVWQGVYFTPANFSGWGLRPGHIMQMRKRNGEPHTLIIEAVYVDKLKVRDSNWGYDNKVQAHDVTLSWFINNVEAWTVYQIK